MKIKIWVRGRTGHMSFWLWISWQFPNRFNSRTGHVDSSWGHHTSSFRRIYLILSSLCESFSRSLSHLSISFSIWETACFCNATLVIFPSIHCHFFFALFVFSFWFLTAFGLFRWFWLILLCARLNNDTWKIRNNNLRFDKCTIFSKINNSQYFFGVS